MIQPTAQRIVATNQVSEAFGEPLSYEGTVRHETEQLRLVMNDSCLMVSNTPARDRDPGTAFSGFCVQFTHSQYTVGKNLTAELLELYETICLSVGHKAALK